MNDSAGDFFSGFAPSLVLSDQALPAGWDFSQFLFSYIL